MNSVAARCMSLRSVLVSWVARSAPVWSASSSPRVAPRTSTHSYSSTNLSGDPNSRYTCRSGHSQ